MEDKTEAFVTFEGGGAKGLAHAGALRAAEEKFSFIGVAGTSAGAIIAALLAAGYKADEIYSRDDPESLFSINLTDLLNPKEWSEVKLIRDRMRTNAKKPRHYARITSLNSLTALLFLAAAAIFGCVAARDGISIIDRFVHCGIAAILLVPAVLLAFSGHFRKLVSHWFFSVKRYRLFGRLIRTRGMMSTDPFRTWLNNKMRLAIERGNPSFRPSGENGSVTFDDLESNLKVIACNYRTKSIKVFERSTDGDVAIADAVCASISIPLIFQPKRIGQSEYVDGGIMSNFPVWVFDAERKTAPRMTPTIGFRLVARTKGTETDNNYRFLAFVRDICYAAVFGDNTLETRNISTFHEAILKVDIGLLDFDINDARKGAVCDSAYVDARQCLVEPIHRIPDKTMGSVLQLVEKVVRGATRHEGHLRLSVMLPNDLNRLEIVYKWNMDSDDDTDDQLAFAKGQGACGKCWETTNFVVCDLEKAANAYSTKWGMDKRQQRLVRRDLKSLCCIPIFQQSKLEESKGDRKRAFVGVLSIDSTDNIVETLTRIASQPKSDLIECAAMVGKQLYNWRLI
jgi:NTE family protein